MKDGGYVNDINVIVAIIPSLFLCLYVYKKDVVEKEPIDMLVRLFFLGVLMTAPTFYVEQSLLSLTSIETDNYLNCFITSFFIVATVEEGFKYLILYFGSWKNKNFNHKFDAIVYAVFISLGFATLENILYVDKYGTSTAFIRAIISVPAHAFYAISSGFFLGLAKNYAIKKDNSRATRLKIFGILIPIILHGTFDFLLLTNNDVLLGIFYSFVACLYLISFISIEKVSNVEMLGEEKIEKKEPEPVPEQENKPNLGQLNINIQVQNENKNILTVATTPPMNVEEKQPVNINLEPQNKVVEPVMIPTTPAINIEAKQPINTNIPNQNQLQNTNNLFNFSNVNNIPQPIEKAEMIVQPVTNIPNNPVIGNNQNIETQNNMIDPMKEMGQNNKFIN